MGNAPKANCTAKSGHPETAVVFEMQV